MKDRPRRMHLLVSLALFLLVISGCASSNMVSSWHDPLVENNVQGTLLVVAVSHRDTVRKLFEDSYKEALDTGGITVVPGYTVTGPENPVSYSAVVEAVAETGADVVLVTKLANVSENTVQQLATGQKYDTIDNLEKDSIFFNPMPKQTTKTTTRVQLISRLYDVKSGKLFWTAITESKDPVMTKKYIQSLTGLIVDDLEKKNIL